MTFYKGTIRTRRESDAKPAEVYTDVWWYYDRVGNVVVIGEELHDYSSRSAVKRHFAMSQIAVLTHTERNSNYV